MKFIEKPQHAAPKNSVKLHLHRHLSKASPGRSYKNVHASDLTKPEGMCPRMYALADRIKAQPEDEWLTTSQTMTFQIGRDQERNIVQWLADMGKVFGHWKCVNCGSMYSFRPRPTECTSCGFKRFEHKEVRFESKACGASCGIDMLAAFGEAKLRVVELKTIDKDQFKDLKAPLSEHKWRTELYLKIIADSDSPWSSRINTEEATILYVSKGGFGTLDPDLKVWGLHESFSPFKEYVIKRNDESVESLFRRAEVVKRFRSKEIGMPSGLCPTALSKRAKDCPMRKVCFSGEHPVEHDWSKEC